MVCWVLVSILVVMCSEQLGIFDLGVILQHFLVDQFAGQGVPKANNIVSIHCGKDLAFLRPSEIVV